MNRFRTPLVLMLLCLVTGIAAVAYFVNASSRPEPAEPASPASSAPADGSGPTNKVIVGEQAQKNLGLTAKSLQSGVFWKTATMQGMVVDRPGFSDREVVAPVTGTIGQLFHVPGDMVRPGDKLFTLKLASESLQQTQADLARTSEESKHAQARL